ncbi:hypothetical protein DSM112329_05379 [Paraconexibacter sp. AEG42_29]|uniref:DUF1330 domain-containing protein n=1 Tax=Paraconexibacter sp. AEG42_29 TaxID=2997339 RepID=A0AAU7B481_9ACTN
MPSLYALNLFDLAPNDDYREYSKRSRAAVEKHGGAVVALGRLAGAPVSDGAEPRQVMILVEWESPEAFQGFQDDPGHADLHPLREGGTANYLWWTYDRLDDLRPLLGARRDAAVPTRPDQPAS